MLVIILPPGFKSLGSISTTSPFASLNDISAKALTPAATFTSIVPIPLTACTPFCTSLDPDVNHPSSVTGYFLPISPNAVATTEITLPALSIASDCTLASTLTTLPLRSLYSIFAKARTPSATLTSISPIPDTDSIPLLTASGEYISFPSGPIAPGISPPKPKKLPNADPKPPVFFPPIAPNACDTVVITFVIFAVIALRSPPSTSLIIS